MTRLKKGKNGEYFQMKNNNNNNNNNNIDNNNDKDTSKIIKIINNNNNINDIYSSMENNMGQFIWQRIESVEGIKNLYNVNHDIITLKMKYYMVHFK